MCLFKKKRAAKKAAEEMKAKEAKKAQEEKEAKAKKEKEEKEAKEKRDSQTKVYHVSKREEDGLWAVKFANGEKVIKTFKTKPEAVEYANSLAINQEGAVVVHASKGKNKGRITSGTKKA